MTPVRASHQIVCTIPTASQSDGQGLSPEGAMPTQLTQPATPQRRGRPEPLLCEVDGGTTWSAGPMATPKTGDRPDMTSSLELGSASFRGSAVAMAPGMQVSRPSTANSCGTPTGGVRQRTLAELDHGAVPFHAGGARTPIRRSGSFGQSRGAPAIAPLGTEVCQPTSTSFQPSGLSTPKTADRPDLNSSLLMGSATFRGSATPKGAQWAAGFTDHFPSARPQLPSTPSNGTRRISISSVRTVPIRRASGVSLRA
mmetsp:Transcript_66113/g.123334  ORF Transcript_66113/g.123334 Transcript_66113/m.123334 type:complete len:255 (+) Transcript_66113:57-821(+)